MVLRKSDAESGSSDPYGTVLHSKDCDPLAVMYLGIYSPETLAVLRKSHICKARQPKSYSIGACSYNIDGRSSRQRVHKNYQYMPYGVMA